MGSGNFHEYKMGYFTLQNNNITFGFDYNFLIFFLVNPINTDFVNSSESTIKKLISNQWFRLPQHCHVTKDTGFPPTTFKPNFYG